MDSVTDNNCVYSRGLVGKNGGGGGGGDCIHQTQPLTKDLANLKPYPVFHVKHQTQNDSNNFHCA